MQKYIRNLFLYLLILSSLFGSVSTADISLVINEFMASNSSCLQDPQGQYDDWIEIYNYGLEAIDIAGMYLTDNLSVPTKWQVPVNNPAATTIAAGGFLLIWADNDTTDAGLHTNFKLDADGEQIPPDHRQLDGHDGGDDQEIDRPAGDPPLGPGIQDVIDPGAGHEPFETEGQTQADNEEKGPQHRGHIGRQKATQGPDRQIGQQIDQADQGAVKS